MDRLVKILADGKHPVLFEPRIDDYNDIKNRLHELKFVFIQFIDTIGKTELGINIEDELTNLKDADFENKTGMICVTGTCQLNFHKVRCTANIDLGNKHGFAKLEIIKRGNHE